jgi:hypothetical protein
MDSHAARTAARAKARPALFTGAIRRGDGERMIRSSSVIDDTSIIPPERPSEMKALEFGAIQTFLVPSPRGQPERDLRGELLVEELLHGGDECRDIIIENSPAAGLPRSCGGTHRSACPSPGRGRPWEQNLATSPVHQHTPSVQAATYPRSRSSALGPTQGTASSSCTLSNRSSSGVPKRPSGPSR